MTAGPGDPGIPLRSLVESGRLPELRWPAFPEFRAEVERLDARALSELGRARATDSQWLSWLGLDRTFDPLRSEPRFTALLRELGLDNVRGVNHR